MRSLQKDSRTASYSVCGFLMARLPTFIVILTVTSVVGFIVVEQGGSTGDESTADAVGTIATHTMVVELDPSAHRLQANDRMVVKIRQAGRARLVFSLNAALRVHSITLLHDDREQPVRFVTQAMAPEGAEQNAHQITVEWNEDLIAGQTVILSWRYEGRIDEPPREPRHLRFVTPSETAGHIGPEGIYLSGETHWYPDLPDSLSSFDVQARLPAGWQAVTHGRRLQDSAEDGKSIGTWVVKERTEALTLVANQFVRSVRKWQGIDVETYLFAEDAALAAEYLDASIRYLDVYTRLLGPYPYPKFAVVENFFASGLGMPSFTLLGSGVIKRHYVQPYALGHEIVHSWIGNWVFNRPDTGNWVEGLTTYLANYYYEELTGTAAQARDQRRMMVIGYAVYVRPDQDYALGRFTRKTDQKDNAIGYQKAAMVFHMLRREIGEDAFWTGIRALIERYGEQYASWADLEHVFSMAAASDLRWFFAQWVDQAGAPAIDAITVEGHESSRAAGQTITIYVTQRTPAYRVKMPVSIELGDGRTIAAGISLTSETQSFRMQMPGRAVAVQLDPEFEIFRRIDRRDLHPMLNLFVTDRHRTVVLPHGISVDELAPYQTVAARLASQEPTGHLDTTTGEDGVAPPGSVLVLGDSSHNRAAEMVWVACGDRVRKRRDGIAIGDRVYQGPQLAVLLSCRRPENREDVLTLFYGTPSAVAKVARLLFFYGWASYVIFDDGKVVARGDFIEEDPLKVRLP